MNNSIRCRKILFVSGYLARNGTEAFMMNVFRNIDRSRFHIDFLIFSREDIVYEDEIKHSGSSVFVLPMRKDGFTYYKSLNSFFKKNQYDVIHWCTCSCTTVAPLFFSYCHHVPVRVTHSHNSNCIGLHNKILHFIQRPLMNLLTTDRLACSDKASKWLFGKRDSVIVKNGIDIKKFSYNTKVREKIRREFDISDTTSVIGHVGRFDPVKNHSFIIDIFARYAECHDSVLLLIGIGALEKQIRNKVKSLHLESKVVFLYERSDVPDLLQAMDLFIMPSLFEGLPFVLVEAQAAGLPCLVSENVDPHIKITPHLSFMSLNQSNDEWAKMINIILEKYKRVNLDYYIKKSGFDIDSTVRRLEYIYNK